MKSFFKYLLASILGFMIAGLLSFLILMGIFAGMASSADKQIELKEKTVLKISLNKQIHDRASENPFEGFSPMSFSMDKALGLNQILKNIKKAETDENIEGIYLNLIGIPAGMAQIQEIRQALEHFKESGKFIIAHSYMYSQKAYYLASVADRVYLTPEGAIDYRGIAANSMFFTKMFDKLGIEAQIIRGKNNKFKSAVEPFFLTKMSEANKEQTRTYIKSIWGQMTEAIGKDRNISEERLNEIADKLLVRDHHSAVEYGFVDELKYTDQIIDELKDSVGINHKKKLNVVGMTKYTNAKPKLTEKSKKKFSRDKIAVIYAQGEIGMDGGSFYSIGTENIAKALRKARKDSSVKAVVFRVNSPGGSALTSEIIYREAKLTKEAKPFVVSMGTYAASGGYYISCMADKIYAQPTTLTGSIGVFGVIMAGEELINKKMGLRFDGVKTNEYADFGGPAVPFPLFGSIANRNLTAQEHEIIQESVQNVYDVFVGHVAEGRSMTYEQVDKIGQGRVWTGENAIEIGLVDELGGIKEAVAAAKELAELEDYRIVEYPVEKDPVQQILEDLTGEAKVRILQRELGENYRYYKALEKAMNYQGIQARMIEVEIY